MKKTIAFTLMLMIIPVLFAQGAMEKTEITVFAAQSMKASVSEAGRIYMEENPDVEVIFTFDSSGNLVKMLDAGAECDIFVSADTATMDKIDPSSDGKDYIISETRIDLLQNMLVLAVPDGNPKNVTSFDECIEKLASGEILFAMGDTSVPAGNYTRKVFAFYGINEEEVKGNITYGTNVAAVARQVKEGAADAGTIYSTDAFSSALRVIDKATDEMTGGPVIYPAAVLSRTKNRKGAEAFLSWLHTSEGARSAFEGVGFTVL
ncbi:MAG: molybdate ABC transporter substrate-binding protein [Bullifex sp.]